jgi:diaminopimelate decarboxylase
LPFPMPIGLTVRYAAKASPNASILKFFSSKGIHMDCSSGYEVRRAMAAGIPADHISLSSRRPMDFADLMDIGVKVNAW